MRVLQPIADEWGEDYLVYVASSRTVMLTEPLMALVTCAQEDGTRPVLVTGPGTRVSPFVSLAMRRAGGFWAVREHDGVVYDAMSGYQIRGFRELWEPPVAALQAGERLRHPAFQAVGAPPGSRGTTLMFDVFVHQRARESTTIGGLAETLVGGLGGGRLVAWDTAEPVAQPWDAGAVTETARRGMPVAPPVLARGETGSFATISVARTPRGLLEQAKGGVPLVGAPDRATLVSLAGQVLARVEQDHAPTIGFVSLSDLDPGGMQTPEPRLPEVPLAALIGPRGVRDLQVDIDDLRRRHDVVQLGRARVPSLLVRFSRPDVGLWSQLGAFAFDLGLERVVSAAGLTGGTADAH